MASLLAIYGDRGSNQKLKKGGFMISTVVIEAGLSTKKCKLKKFALLP